MVYFTINAKIAVPMAEYARTAPAPDGLLDQLIEASAVEQAGDRRGCLRCGDQTHHERTDDAAHQVDTHDVERIVEAQLELQADGQGAHHTGDHTDGQCAKDVHRGAGRG